MIPFPDNLPRWDSRQKNRQRLQQWAGRVMVVATVGGAAFWWVRLAPAPETLTVAGVLLAALPLGLWLLLDCPERREQRPEELAVFNTGKAVPGPPITLAMMLVFWLVLPALLQTTGSARQELGDWPVIVLWTYLFMALMVYLLVALRNEVVFLAPDGTAECWDTLGRHRLVETRPVSMRLQPLLGRCYLCDETGRVLYHLDRGMTNVEPALDWLQARGVAHLNTEVRQQLANPWPKVLRVMDWDEADRIPAHRWISWLRLLAWLPPFFLLAQWWLLVQGLGVLGLCPASLIACWLPLVFLGVYLVWPQIFVWQRYPSKPRLRGLRQILATKAWRRMHVNLSAAILPAGGALLWAVVESMAFQVSDAVRMALLCVVIGLLLAVLCGMRCPRERGRERWMLVLLAAVLAFPLGYSLNLALSQPAHPDTGTVLAVQPPKTENDSATLTIQWQERTLEAILYEEAALLPQPGETIDLCVRESPLGIPLVSICSD